MDTIEKPEDLKLEHDFQKFKTFSKWTIFALIVNIFVAIIVAIFEKEGGLLLVIAITIAQVIFGVIAAFYALRRIKTSPFKQLMLSLVCLVLGVSGFLVLFIDFLVVAFSSGFGGGFGGGAWGRPLRLKGQVIHPDLTRGSDWTRGNKPQTQNLTPATAKALEALWLHDAQKEHASVPAFSRLSWQLIGVGAPASLIEAVHQAALEEIEHTRLCFALAEGYGGESHTVQPMPQLLQADFAISGNPWVHLARESLVDGGLLEDYNADVAHECAQVCQEPVTKKVLEQIAREERSHAALSWKIVAYCLEHGGADVHQALQTELTRLPQTPRPTAATPQNQIAVDASDPQQMQVHGRLPDARWAQIWQISMERAIKRLRSYLAQKANDEVWAKTA